LGHGCEQGSHIALSRIMSATSAKLHLSSSVKPNSPLSIPVRLHSPRCIVQVLSVLLPASSIHGAYSSCDTEYARVQPFRCRSLYIYCFHTVQPFLAPRKPALHSPSRCSARRLCCMPFQLHWQGLPAVRVTHCRLKSFPCMNSATKMAGSAKRAARIFTMDFKCRVPLLLLVALCVNTTLLFF
jgi:hypothetical protein